MKRTATTLVAASLLALSGLLAAGSSFALDLRPQQAPQANPQQQNRGPVGNAVLGCDNGITWSGYFQYTDDRLGNKLNFGGGGMLSSVSFTHYDYGTAGPYNYNLEVWDPTSCTLVAARNGLVAASSVFANTTETVDLCANNIHVSGNLIVAIDPNTCNNAFDCYPDLVYDNQLNVACPYIISDASTAAVCSDVSQFSGPFLLHAAVDECVVPVREASWGQIKAIYR